ncbi:MULTISPECIES: Rnf-Nqr domain containing protein [unclassified Pseudomonas]|uniref:Rnf-Nqr domain containing protein n=1 Tax=unclassified Pseudomonas TaxID=196821 RepID=UPI00128F70B9|nr:Rnf-Nqr domain containing protein [Pseudomonas sp. MN1F]MQG91703.1 electron transporter RnfA [Pseudomonas sp. MN1F]
MNDYLLILASAALFSHLLLQQQPLSRLRLQVCGLAGALSIALGASGGLALERLIVAPWQLQDLRLFLLLPWLALLAWGVPQVLGRLRAQWPTSNLALPLLGNALLLGLALQVTGDDTSALATLRWGALAGLGFWLALVLFDDLHQRCQHAEIPAALRGLPISLIGAGVMALAFSGFNGLFTQ